MFKDSTLQIFLTIVHGTLIGTFCFDYIVRNSVRWFLSGFNWVYISNVALGVVFAVIIIWAIISVWNKIRRNLFICLIVLVVIFIIRLCLGIPEMIEKHRYMNRNQYTEELVVFIAQILIHLLACAANWILANNSI